MKGDAVKCDAADAASLTTEIDPSIEELKYKTQES